MELVLNIVVLTREAITTSVMEGYNSKLSSLAPALRKCRRNRASDLSPKLYQLF